MSAPRSNRFIPLLLASLLLAGSVESLQAASSPTDRLLRIADLTQTTQPEATQPESAQPDTTQPDTTQPENTQPDTTQPDTTQPDTTQPDTTQPDTTQPGAPAQTQPPPAPLPMIPPAPNQSPIRIGLGRSMTSGQTKTAQGLYILADERLIATAPPGATITFTLSPTGQVQLGGGVQPVATGAPDALPTTVAPVSGTLRLVPMPAAPPLANWITWGEKSYRGQAEIRRSISAHALTFINLLNLEEYLYGVVPAEMSPSWAPEALKAQAVSARTYALRHMASYPSEGFDMTDTTNDQAYGGLLKEHPNTTAAVQATTGEVILYQGKLAETFYHASSGGHTEPISFPWGGGSLPYLIGVPDYDNIPANPYYRWSLDFELPQLESLLRANGVDVGQIHSIEPASPPNYEGGRPPTWKVTGSTGEKIVRGPQIRTMLGLRAAPTTVLYLTANGEPVGGQVQTPPAPPTGPNTGTAPDPAPQSLQVLGANGKMVERSLKGAVIQGASAKTATLGESAVAQGADGRVAAFQPPAPAPTPVPPPAPTPAPGPTQPPAPGSFAKIRFDGGGWGHLAGMSQYGAYGMALQGKTYREILAHYYTGTKVERS